MGSLLPAVNDDWSVGSVVPLHKSQEVQKRGGAGRDAKVRPGRVLKLGDLPGVPGLRAWSAEIAVTSFSCSTRDLEVNSGPSLKLSSETVKAPQLRGVSESSGQYLSHLSWRVSARGTLTFPFSTSFVSMAMTLTFCSHTILQKSSNLAYVSNPPLGTCLAADPAWRCTLSPCSGPTRLCSWR